MSSMQDAAWFSPPHTVSGTPDQEPHLHTELSPAVTVFYEQTMEWQRFEGSLQKKKKKTQQIK